MNEVRPCRRCGAVHRGWARLIEMPTEGDVTWTMHFARSPRLCYICALCDGMEEFTEIALSRGKYDRREVGSEDDEGDSPA